MKFINKWLRLKNGHYHTTIMITLDKYAIINIGLTLIPSIRHQFISLNIPFISIIISNTTKRYCKIC